MILRGITTRLFSVIHGGGCEVWAVGVVAVVRVRLLNGTPNADVPVAPDDDDLRAASVLATGPRRHQLADDPQSSCPALGHPQAEAQRHEIIDEPSACTVA